MIPPGVASGWKKVQPAKIRARLCGHREGVPPRVWDLGGLTEGGRLPVEVGDRLIARAPWLGSDIDVSGPDVVVQRAAVSAMASGEGAEFDIAGPIDADAQLTVASRENGESWSITLMPTPGKREGLLARPRSTLLVGMVKETSA